jgi:peroxiredoxin
MTSDCRKRRPAWVVLCGVGSLAVLLILVPISACWFQDGGQKNLLQVTTAGAVLKIPAKDFQLKDLNGSMVRLSNFRGKRAVLLYFWATWCPGCIAAKPAVAKLRTAVSADQMEILAINVGAPDSLERLMQYQKKNPAPYPVLYDGSGEVSAAYQVMGIPLFILVDKDGSVVYRNNMLPGNVEKLLGR